MPAVQTTYSDSFAKGFPGMVANGETSNRISRTVETAAGIGFGQPAYRGSGENGCIAGDTFDADAVGAADAGNAGGGTITAAPAVAAGAKPGAYKVVHTSAGATAAFDVFDPDGIFVGNGATGTEFVGGGLTFTVTDSAADPAIGDSYTITVTYAANADFLGLVIADKTITPVPGGAAADIVAQYDSAALMDMGTMWVTAGATVTAGQRVYWNPATARYTATTTHIPVPAVFETGGGNGDLVRVKLYQDRAA